MGEIAVNLGRNSGVRAEQIKQPQRPARLFNNVDGPRFCSVCRRARCDVLLVLTVCFLQFWGDNECAAKSILGDGSHQESSARYPQFLSPSVLSSTNSLDQKPVQQSAYNYQGAC
jgi:hypothetical protein